MYIRYLQIMRRLEECYDQLLQPQKRADVRILLDSCIGRMLELKHQIVNHCGEYVNFDDVLVDLKLTPDVLEIPIPKYFLEERQQELEERNKLLDALIKQYGQPQVRDETAQETEPLPQLTPDQAIQIVQCNERGRQGRQRAKFMKEIREQEERERKVLEFGSMESDPQEAATRIQKIFKGFLARKQTTKMCRDELEFLGMEPTRTKEKLAQQHRWDQILIRRKLHQQQNQQELEQERIQMRQRIKDLEGGKIMEDLHDVILEKIIHLRQTSEKGEIPEFPTEEEGGSFAFLQDKPELTEEEKLIEEERKKKEEAEAARKAKKGKKETKKSTAKKKGKGKKKGDEEEMDTTEELKESKFWLPFAEGTQRYVDIWQNRFDALDFGQKYDKALLREAIMEGPGGLMAELRSYVDALVRVELANLKAAVERDKVTKRGKKGGKKGGKGGKKGKKGKEKDLTAGKKIESLVNELVWTGFLQQCPKVKVGDYVGAHNLMGAVMDEAEKVSSDQVDDMQKKWKQVLDNWNDNIEQQLQVSQDQFRSMFDKWVDQRKSAGFVLFEPSMSQVRQNTTEYCVLPLGSKVVHDLAPHHNAVLFYGPASSGKTLLTHSVVTETGSNFFNLSPSNLQEKYNNAKAVQMLLHMIFKVAKAMAPSVIYIDEAEKVFAGGKGKRKKKKAADGGKAARIKKDLLLQMKELEPSDRVLVIGNSRCPWEADNRELLKFFTCMIYTVHPDYASRLLLWNTLIEKKGAKIPHQYDTEILAYMSNKYTSGTIAKVINQTLTERRVRRLAQRPLKADEFLAALSKVTPVFKEDFEQFKQFTLNLPLCMRKKRQDDFVKKDDEEDDKKKKKKTKKKKE
eukprot:TRINITY_DN66651_c5_g1_i1.p1 TRINITY_DN66651_c5_g1~~TRINITY_DN66651_c5_g1_i1.p1  ORF type:complete len:928 (-),score=183.27 TRINITY_DN66651_c5_g1_i1:1437-4001(-)